MGGDNAGVSTSFMNTICDIAEERCRRLVQRNKGRRQVDPEDVKRVAALKGLAQGDTAAILHAHNTLTSLGYSKFGVMKVVRRDDGAQKEKLLMFARTTPIIMKEVFGAQARVVRRWDIGEYDIFVPVEYFTGALGIHDLHFVPARKPDVTLRFPHHTLQNPMVLPMTKKPYDYPAHTCGGSFTPMLSALKTSGLVVETFRAFREYLSVYDPHSVYFAHDQHGRTIYARPEEAPEMRQFMFVVEDHNAN